MAEVIDCLFANKISLNFSKAKYMSITNKYFDTYYFNINVNDNRIEIILSYNYLGVIL